MGKTLVRSFEKHKYMYLFILSTLILIIKLHVFIVSLIHVCCRFESSLLV